MWNVNVFDEGDLKLALKFEDYDIAAEACDQLVAGGYFVEIYRV